MPIYRNRNSGRLVELDEPSPRLERMARWERLVDERPKTPAQPAPEKPAGPAPAAVEPDEPEKPAQPAPEKPAGPAPAAPAAVEPADSPRPSIPTILAEVGGDAQKAKAALKHELASDAPRPSLVKKLEKLVEGAAA